MQKDIRSCWLKTNILKYGSNVEKNENLLSEFNQRLLESVKQDGVKEPILVINTPNGKLVKVGNTRLWAAKTLGIKKLSCIVVTLERHCGKVNIPEGRKIENIYNEFKLPILWVERKNYIALKCTHSHIGHTRII